MGCGHSKVENQECVWRCKQRRRFMKGALTSRNALADAYIAYFACLKNCSMAFHEYSLRQFDQQILPSSPRASSSSPVIVRVSRALEATPSTPVTVVYSPPTSHSSIKESTYLEYLYNDAPPPGLYSDIPIPAPAQSSPEPIYQSEERVLPSTIDSMGSTWDFLDLFRPVSSYMGYEEIRKSKGEDRKEDFEEVFEEETMPALQEDDGFQDVEVKNREVDEFFEPGKEEINTQIDASSSKMSDLNVEPNTMSYANVAPEKSIGLQQVLKEIDDNFLKASVAAKEICRLLGANKNHHSNSDSRRFSDHSSRFLGSVSRGYWSPKTPLSWTSNSDDSAAEDTPVTGGSLILTLDRLYAWEKRLYDEMKEVERLKIDFAKQRKLLQNLYTKGEEDEKVDRTRSVIKSIESELMVAVEAIEKTSLAIRSMTEEDLCPQLMDLLEGLANMWKQVSDCHAYQNYLVKSTLVPKDLPKVTSPLQHATIGLESALNAWQISFGSVLSKQKAYLLNLLGWLNHIFISETDLKLPSLPKISQKIFQLCKCWKEALHDEELQEKEKLALNAIKTFAGRLQIVIARQNEEASILKNIEFLSRELTRKVSSLNSAQRKYSDLAVVHEDDPAGGKVILRSPLSEKRAAVEALNRALAGEHQKLTQAHQATQEVTIWSLKNGLPELFTSVSDFTTLYSENHKKVLSQAKNGKLTSG